MLRYTITALTGITLLSGSVYAASTLPAVVSGGVGSESRNHIEAVQNDYDLKLVFTGDKGIYLSDVSVDILDNNGKSVSRGVTEGPYLLANLERGNYVVKASIDGITKERNVFVNNKNLQVSYIRFPVKDEPIDEKQIVSSLKERMNTQGLNVNEVFTNANVAK